MSVTILRGNALDLPLADNSVDLVVTSPPYFGLRSYQDGGEHYEGQIGSEPTPAEFVDALLAATREMVRVTKPSGSIFVNLGDSYAGSGKPYRGAPSNGSAISAKDSSGTNTNQARIGGVEGIRPKSLTGIPWRYALRCIDDLGLILRAEIIWSKPNGLPESVTDRVRRSHEQWFHFTLRPRYFSAVDEVREEHSQAWGPIDRVRGVRNVKPDGTPDGGMVERPNPLGKLPGSVWSIPTQPLTVPAHLGVDHFAAFPMELPRRIIRGWSPSGVCTACGEGRRPVADKEAVGRVQTGPNGMGDIAGRETLGLRAVERQPWANDVIRTITGYACACPDTTAPTRPSVVVDPFGGTGTTALVAHALGRHGISVDMSADYCRLARWRTSDRGQLASALEVEKPAPVMDGQAELFEEWTA